MTIPGPVRQVALRPAGRVARELGWLLDASHVALSLSPLAAVLVCLYGGALPALALIGAAASSVLLWPIATLAQAIRKSPTLWLGIGLYVAGILAFVLASARLP